MACQLSTGYTSTDSCDDQSFPGVDELYIGNRKEITAFKYAPDGAITGITGTADAYQFDIVEDSAQTLQDFQVANKIMLQTLNYQVAYPTQEQQDVLNKLKKAKTFAVSHQGDKYYFFGQFAGGLKLATMSIDSGTTVDSFAGVTISMTGKSGIVAKEIRGTALASLGIE